MTRAGFVRTLALVGPVVTLALSSRLLADDQQTSRDVAVKPSVGTASIVGTIVTDEATSRPLRRVTVTLSLAGTGISAQRVTTTDDAGRFAFTRLPDGNYSPPRATKPGFVPVQYGQKRVGGIGTPITLGEGQKVTIALKMLRGGVITGTVLDQSGKPTPQVQVQATQVRIVNGARTAAPVFGGTSASTDDRGVYRIYGLAPGDYVVYASPRLQMSGEVRPITQAELDWAHQQLQSGAAVSPVGGPAAPPRPGQAVAYTPVYYPGTTDAASAAVVTIVAGQERSGIDFGVQYVPTARIEGAVIDPDGQTPQNVQVNLVSKIDTSTTFVDSFMIFESMMMMRPTTVDGRFSIPGVRPGEYMITARAAQGRATGAPAGPPVAVEGRGGGAPAAPMLWASADISVNGQDQSGLTLRLQPGMTLSGKVAFDGTTLQPPTDLTRVSVGLRSAPTAGGVTVSVGVPGAQVAADGTFTFAGVTPGRYLISASAPGGAPTAGPSWTVRSVVANGVDVADVPLEIKPQQDVSNVLVTFTDKTTEVSGTLLDAAGRPTPEFSIILFSTDRTMWSQRSRRLRVPVRASTEGKFRFTNLPPGEYYMAALTDFEPNDYYNPTFLDQVAAAGAIKITLAEGEKKVQDLRIAGGL